VALSDSKGGVYNEQGIDLAAAGKRIVLVGTKRQVKLMVEEEGKRLGIPYINQRWMGGLITNWKQLKQTLDRLNSLKQKREAGQLKTYIKKEQLLFDKEIIKLERIVGGIASLKEAPEVVVVFDTHKEKLAVKEASNRGVTVVGLVDSNANPDKVDYLIPMNDDSAKALEIMVRVLGQAIENGLKKLKESKIQVTQQLNAEIPLFLIDQDRMQQVFINLVKNSIQAMVRGGKLNIQTGLKDKLCFIQIQDTGVGIPESKLPKIFDAYFTTKEEGSGLGLMIAYQIISEHHGRIEATSKVNMGTTFRIVLPIRKEKLELPLNETSQKGKG